MTTATATATPISKDAFLSRVRRRLRKEGQTLHLVRSADDQMGPLYIADANNVVVAYACTYESLERDLQVLKPGEALPTEY